MLDKNPIDSGGRTLRDLVSMETIGQDWPPPRGLAGIFSKFAQIQFDVPDAPEVDGFLFEYGRFDFTSQPTFVVSLARQLEKFDESGEHDSYSQVSCEFAYEVDSQLESVGSKASWWFSGAGETLDSRLAMVAADEVWDLVQGKQPLSFEVRQEVA